MHLEGIDERTKLTSFQFAICESATLCMHPILGLENPETCLRAHIGKPAFEAGQSYQLI